MGTFLELLGRGVAGLARFPLGAELWPVTLATLLLLVIVLIALVTSQSQRLNRMSRRLQELSNVVQRQARAIEQLRDSEQDDVPSASAQLLGRVAENQNPDMVQSADGPVDLQEQLKALREVMLAEMSK